MSGGRSRKPIAAWRKSRTQGSKAGYSAAQLRDERIVAEAGPWFYNDETGCFDNDAGEVEAYDVACAALIRIANRLAKKHRGKG